MDLYTKKNSDIVLFLLTCVCLKVIDSNSDYFHRVSENKEVYLQVLMSQISFYRLYIELNYCEFALRVVNLNVVFCICLDCLYFCTPFLCFYYMYEL